MYYKLNHHFCCYFYNIYFLKVQLHQISKLDHKICFKDIKPGDNGMNKFAKVTILSLTDPGRTCTLT